MSFTRFDAVVLPRKLSDYERANWRRKDGTERDCVLVYDYELGREIPAGGGKVAITSREAYGAYKRMERDGDIEIRMPSEPLPQMRAPEPKIEEPKPAEPKAQDERQFTPRKKKGED